MPAGDPHLLWITSRAAGTAAIVCSSASVGLGVMIGGRLVPPGRGRATTLRTAHETLALAALVALILHAATLLLDTWLKPGLTGILVPFTMSYRPFFTGLGILAGYALIVLGLSAYARGILGERWKRIHRLTAVAWLLGVVHVIGSGTDVTRPWYAALLTLCVLPVLVLIFIRVRTARPELFTMETLKQEAR
ncbi:ferric reductase-like transmembrane domain-containing protein [Paraconexibacter sp.]|uniref:ferric reductase-like transmembrane domain-containing protein n=1 Tax=Paraconexibacter sp. TaxID=2949640 RepID=UPI0035697569